MKFKKKFEGDIVHYTDVTLFDYTYVLRIPVCSFLRKEVSMKKPDFNVGIFNLVLLISSSTDTGKW